MIVMERAPEQTDPAPVPSGLTAPMHCSFDGADLVLLATAVSSGARTCASVRCPKCGAEFLIVVTMALLQEPRRGGQNRMTPGHRVQLTAARARKAKP